MIELKIGSNKVELISSLTELTAEREHAINKLVVMDINVGSTMQHVYQHLSQLSLYASENKPDEVNQEVKNLHNNFFMMINGLNLQSLALTPFIKSINGKHKNATTSEEAKNVSDELLKTGITQDQIQDQLNSLKKKLMANFEPSFLIGSGLKEEQMFLQN
jgi:molybdopterin converting factor small subunit